MARRLLITPEGVGGEKEVSLSDATCAGCNDAVVLNDHYEIPSDGTYTNTE